MVGDNQYVNGVFLSELCVLDKELHGAGRLKYTYTFNETTKAEIYLNSYSFDVVMYIDEERLEQTLMLSCKLPREVTRMMKQFTAYINGENND